MEITYNLGNYGTYTYDADIDEFVDNLSLTELCRHAYEAWMKNGYVDEQLKVDLQGEYPELNLPEGFNSDNITADLIECAKFVFEDLDDKKVYKLFEMEIDDYFEEDALQECQDELAYEDDKRHEFYAKPLHTMDY